MLNREGRVRVNVDVENVIEQIEADGYSVIPGVYSEDEMDRALMLVQQWREKTRERLDKITQSTGSPVLESGIFVWNLQAKDYYFLELLFRPKFVETVLMHFLNDKWYRRIPASRPNYILRAYCARNSTTRPLFLHIDTMLPFSGTATTMMQVALVVEDQTLENGCTILVPGSHNSGNHADPSAGDSALPITSRKGDVIIWDSRVWHGAGANNNGKSRWLMMATFCRWWMKQMFDIPGTLPDSIYQKLDDSRLAVLGFCSQPYPDELAGIDMRQGYDILRRNPSGQP